MAAPALGFTGILWRFAFAFALVVLTWNPTRFNYVSWALVNWRENLAPLVCLRIEQSHATALRRVGVCGGQCLRDY